MSVFNNFPYTDYHNLNLDWLLKKTKESEEAVKEIPKQIEKEVDKELSGRVIPYAKNPYQGKKIGFIGDSFTYGSGLENRLEERWSAVLCRMLGAVEINVAEGGTGFLVAPNKTNNFFKQADTLYNTDRNVDVVVVLGGINDLNREYDPHQISDAQLQLFGKLFNYYPNALLVWAGFNYASTAWEQQPKMLHARRVDTLCYYDTINIPYIKITNPTEYIRFSRSNYMQDLVHPTSAACVKMAETAYTSLLGGTYTEFIFQEFILEENCDGGVYGYANGNFYHVYGNVVLNTPIKQSGWVKLANARAPLGNCKVVAGSGANSGEGSFKGEAVRIQVDGSLEIQSYPTNATSYHYFNLTIPLYTN